MRWITPASTRLPHSTLIGITLMLYVLHNSIQRSPNLPPQTAIALSCGESRLTTAASIAPVPDEAKVKISFFVWNKYLSPSLISTKILRNSLVRWWIIGRALAARTCGGRGVGPGVSKYFLFIVVSLSTFSSLPYCFQSPHLRFRNRLILSQTWRNRGRNLAWFYPFVGLYA